MDLQVPLNAALLPYTAKAALLRILVILGEKKSTKNQGVANSELNTQGGHRISITTQQKIDDLAARTKTFKMGSHHIYGIFNDNMSSVVRVFILCV